jgi:hypothetical protein
LEVEGVVRNNYGDEDEVEGDDERNDNGWIAIFSIDQTIFVQLLMKYWRRMNRNNMAKNLNSILFQCSSR